LRLDLIRHGVTLSNLGHRFNDSEDEPLADDALAALAAIKFDASRYDLVFASPLRRAVQTADGLGLRDYVLESRIRERGLGVFQGLTATQCQARYSAEFTRFLTYDADFCIPEGESRRDHLQRVSGWLEEAARSGAQNVLVITHGGTVDFVYRMGIGLPLHGGDSIFGGENLSRSSFRVEWPRVSLIRYDEPLAG
jgi:2,3-bisphosphoglycerate-dependent phosphoglycerate mutase